MKLNVCATLVAIALPVVLAGQARSAQSTGGAAKPMEIYVVDTEGGKATLWISPTGETLLIDSGMQNGTRQGARPDGFFTVTNSRNGFAKTYTRAAR